MQTRQTRQMQIDEDACIRNWTDKKATPETCNLSATTLILTTLIQNQENFIRIQFWRTGLFSDSMVKLRSKPSDDIC